MYVEAEVCTSSRTSIRETRCVSFRRAWRDRRGISALIWYVGARKRLAREGYGCGSNTSDASSSSRSSAKVKSRSSKRIKAEQQVCAVDYVGKC